MKSVSYGQELILDLHECDPETYDTREKIEAFFESLCEMIEVEARDIHFWDYAGRPVEYSNAEDRVKGTSAVQFILTSSIVIHTLDIFKQVYLNVFSCDEFNAASVAEFAQLKFKGRIVQMKVMDRV